MPWIVWMLHVIGITKATILPYFVARGWLVLEVALINIGTKMKHVFLSVRLQGVWALSPSFPAKIPCIPARLWADMGRHGFPMERE